MAENAGTITAEIRADINKLDGDINKATEAFRKIPATVDKTNNATVNKFGEMGKGVHKNLAKMSNSNISQLTKMMGGMQKAIMAVPIVGLIAGIATGVKRLFSQISTFVNDSTNAWIRHQQEIAKVDTILRTSGATSWTTTRQMRDMANEIADASGHSVNEVMKLQSVLLGFRSITGETFERTTVLAADMAAVMGGDLAGAGKNLARALEDPVQGMRLLARYGFVFDSATKANIESLAQQGRQLEAQKIILNNVETAFGGVAAAVNDVNAAQSRIETANERIAIAAGERTSGLALFWRNLRAESREARADFLELQNDIARAQRADYSQHIAQIELLRQNLENTADEFERIAARELLVTAELELDRTKATDALILAERDLRDYVQRMVNAGVKINRELDEEYRRLTRNANRHRERIAAADAEIAIYQQRAAARQQQLTMEEADLAKVAEKEERLREIEERRLDTLREIERAHRAGMITQDEIQVRTMAAYQTEANAINQLTSMSMRLNLSTAAGIRQQEALINSLASGINLAAGEYNRLGEEIRTANATLTSAQFIDFINEQTLAMNRSFITLESNREFDLIDEEEYLQRRLQIQLQFWRAVDNFAARHGVDWRRNEGTFNAMVREAVNNIKDLETILEDAAEAQRIYNEQTRAMERLPMVLQDIRDEYTRQTGSIEEIMAMERRRAWLQIYYSEDYQALLRSEAEEHRRLRDEIKAAFDELWSISKTRSPWGNFMAGAQQYSAQAVGILNAGMKLFANSVRRETDILRRELDERHSLLRESLERDLQARLHYKGFVDAATEEQHKKELELAIQSGDQQRIFLAHSNMERFKIEEEFAQKKAALDEDMAQQKAKLDYRAAVAVHRAQVVSSIASMAQAILMAGVNKWPVPAIPMMAMAGAKGGLQLAAVKANRPRLQAFDSGGIVAGHSFRGDKILARVNSGEMILNAEQQRRLFELADNAANSTGNIGGGKPGTIHITLTLDGRAITKAVVDNVNNRQYLIDGGSIK